jgi:hypothetical protein
LGSNTLLLKSYVDSKIRKIAAVTKVCDRASNANEKILVPAGGNYVRIFQHPPEAFQVIDWSSRGQG